MLETNQIALEKIAADFCDKIKKLKIKENIYIDMAQDGETIIGIQHRNRIWYLNSRYDTQYAVTTYAERYLIRPYGTYFIFGFSDGAHIREFLSRCDRTNHVMICEPCADIFATVCNCYDITDILNDERVALYIPEVTDSIETIMKRTLQYSDFTHVEFCILPGYDVLFRESCETFEDAIIDRIRDELIKKSTTLNFQRSISKNTLLNMKNMIFHKNISQLKVKLEELGVEDIPAIIVSAGPSLDKNIQELKKAEGKAFIIVVDAALRAVIKEGIHPDIVCTIDPNVPERFIEGMDLSEVVWCCGETARLEIIKKYKQSIYYFGFFEKGWNEFLEQILGYPFPLLPTGGSVSTIAFALVCYLGFKKVILIGQDLAFTGGKSHTQGIEGALGDNDAYIKSRYLMEVEGIDGTMLQTDFQMWYYKRWFEKAIFECRDSLAVYDATEGGAKIKGAENCKLAEIIQADCQKPFCFRKIDKDISEAFTIKEREKLRNYFALMKEQALRLHSRITDQINLQRNILESIEGENISGECLAKLEQMMCANEKFEQMELFGMMVSYAQKEEYELGDNIYKEADMSVSELVEENLALFLGYRKAVKMLLEDLEESPNEKDIGCEGAFCL